MFGRPIRVIETGRTIGHRVDAAGASRAPERRCFFHRVQERGDSSPHPAGECSVVRFACPKPVVRSVVGLMRPGTAALLSAVAFSTACRSAGILARPQPVNVRSSDSRDQNRSYDRSSD